MLWNDPKRTASTSISTALLTYYHGDKTGNSMVKDREDEVYEHRTVQLE